MSAITTDNLRIRNCTNFIKDVNDGNYYTFIGLPNYDKYQSDWNTNVPDPVDNFQYLNSYKDSILGVKKINSSDIIRVIPNIVWKTGLKYDMYRHDYKGENNLTPVTNSTRLYDSRYYVMNKDYRVYLCINNGAAPSNNNKGVTSTNEPLHTSETPVEENDNYIWKYLYTISPSDVLKFDGTNYISIPNNWETSTDAEIKRIRDTAVDGKIETVLILKSTTYAINSTEPLNNVPIKGDGVGGLATVEFDENLNPIKVTVTSYGSGYTFGTLDLDSLVSPLDEKSIFDVIIPPPGGHGKNVYTELGGNRVLIYSRIENSITNPDFIEGNQFSRVGVIKDITFFGSSSIFTNLTGSGTFGLIVSGSVSQSEDSLITQNNTKASGVLVSKVSVGSSTIIKYINIRENYQDTYSQANITKTSDPYEVNNYAGLSTPITYNYANFDTSSIDIFTGISSSSYSIYNFSGSQIGDTYLGQDFNSGLSNPDINTKSGEIVYVDNRVSVTRQSQQREDIKIIIEF